MLRSIDVQAVEPLADGATFGAAGAYERVIGTAKGEVDPAAPANKGIALIDKAPRNARGMVEYTTDFFVLRHVWNTPEQQDILQEIVGPILEYRTLTKLKGTYLDTLPQLVQPDTGRIHASFHQTVAATGRLSSSDPNLQNVPRGSNVRSLFVAPEGHTLLVADYDQIELRVMAMFSQDKELMNVFNNNIDIHTGAAALLFKKKIEDVTSEERQIGKGVNFLTAYGGGAGKLARTTGISFDNAQHMIQEYYRQFSGLTEWKQQVVAQGKKYGYVSTLAGRYRRLPDLRSGYQEARSRAERQAVNAVVQGSAADLCKQAMIDIHKTLIGTGAKMLVQVHDELVVAVPDGVLDDIIHPFLTAMGDDKVINGVPLKVSYHHALNWAEAKG